ncbi:ImmA/IrrE family metallo-endopeptidase [Gluconobacter sp. LMG 31484]|uniref:ImmA/IrrE family metallo-endopeptidase n=1 Tax=Gluconobacter vitians TaxID=2728102 RepID=A0ABR9Y119_9PROT|nr:ImmA/IrrE family metallo-endopeptidase [Gluconobacter vitians]MBF0857634.1 ImmA/IrrE family metallo-endopeptidase [Gluconobacter vitians]
MSAEWKLLTPTERQVIEDFQEIAPVRLSALAKALGVTVKAATLAPGISGEIRPEGNSYVIRVNRHDPPKRQRFTVAHELAHFLLHRDQIQEGLKDNVLYRSGLSDTREAQANRLAADILMPEGLIKQCREAAEDKGVGDIILYMSEAMGVSEDAMKIRLGI